MDLKMVSSKMPPPSFLLGKKKVSDNNGFDRLMNSLSEQELLKFMPTL